MLSLLNACDSATAASDSAPIGTGSTCVGPGCQAPIQGKDDYELAVDLGVGGTASATTVTGAKAAASVCGAVSVGCNPDAKDACAHVVLDATGGTTGAGPSLAVGGASTSGYGGSGVDGSGVGGASGVVGGTNSGVGGGAVTLSDTGSTSVGGATSSSASSAVMPSSELACRVVLVNEVAMTTCEAAGTHGANEPCSDRSDCAAGFACVEESGGARCRHYCCGGNDSCSEPGTFCEERDSQRGRQRVPQGPFQASCFRVHACGAVSIG
ncbi:MAG: hypothetical protein QM784_20420 [Polyangiaceae bacterium]